MRVKTQVTHSIMTHRRAGIASLSSTEAVLPRRDFCMPGDTRGMLGWSYVGPSWLAGSNPRVAGPVWVLHVGVATGPVQALVYRPSLAGPVWVLHLCGVASPVGELLSRPELAGWF